LRSEEKKRKRVGEKGKGEKKEKDIRADKSRHFSFFSPFALSTAHLGRRFAMTTRFHDVPLLRRQAPRRLAAFALHKLLERGIKNLFDP